MARDQLSNIVTFVRAEVAKVSDSLSSLKTASIGQWVANFHSAVKSRIRLSLVELTVFFKDQELTNLNFFTQQVIERLEELLNTLNKCLERITYSDISHEKSAPHQQIYKQVAGCTAQCPFCGAQCENNIKHHWPQRKHTTHHRPQCLNKFKWVENNTSILEICTYLVATNADFRNRDTENELHPYTKYYDFYPKWEIRADKTFEVSLYWKWFLGHYYLKIKEKYGHEETEIPQEWKQLQWVEVERWLKMEYQI